MPTDIPLDTKRGIDTFWKMIGLVEGDLLQGTFSITQDTADILEEEPGIDVRAEYTGRGMDFACFGIVSEDGFELMKAITKSKDFCANNGFEDEAATLEQLLKVKPWTDNLGLAKIYYWPNIRVQG